MTNVNVKQPARRARKGKKNQASFDRAWKPWAAGAGGLALILTGIWAVEAVRIHLRLTEAQAQLKRGFHALATETLEPIRYSLTSSVTGCEALMGAYYGAHRADRLEWASQACISAGIETSDTYVGMAAARELAGQDADALKLLQQVAAKFEKSPDPFYRIAQIYRRNKKNPEAADAMMKAADLAPANPQLSMEALELLSALQRWSDAGRLAVRIKDSATENPEVKLLIARALLKAGKTTDAQTVVTQARELINKKPEHKAEIEQAFGDVLNPASAAAASDPARSIASPNGPIVPPPPGAKADPIQMAHPPLSPATPPKAF